MNSRLTWMRLFAAVALVTALGCGESTEANPDGTGTFIVSDVPTRNCTLAFVNGSSPTSVLSQITEQ